MSIVGRGISVGGGGGLKVKVVGGTTQPSNPKEGTIWVKTSSDIGNVYFTNASPESPALNDIWICVNESWISRYIPISEKPYTQLPVGFCCQWNGSYWNGRESKVYMNSEWCALTLVLAHKNLGIGSSADWSAFNSIESFLTTTVANMQAPTLGSSASGITITQVTNKRGTAVYGTSDADTIDFSNYDSIIMYYYDTASSYRELCIATEWPDPSSLTNNKYATAAYTQKNNASTSSTTNISVDCSAITGDGYVAIGINNKQIITIAQLILYPVS